MIQLNKNAIITLLLCFAFSGELIAQPSGQLKLWYNKPASGWNEALPIGNGFLAGMIFGGVQDERLQLNEETIWAGEPGNNILPGVYESIVRIRKLLFEGKYKEAQDLSNHTFPRSAPEGANYGMQYQTAGSLLIRFDHRDFKDYKRELDISKAVASVTYRSNGVTYKREYIAVIPQKAIVVRLSASKPKSISCTLDLNTPFNEFRKSTKEGRLSLSATTSSVDNKKGRVRFQIQVLPQVQGGNVSEQNDKLNIKNADVVTLLISAATNYNNYNDISGDEVQRTSARLAAISKDRYTDLKAEHIKNYQKFFNRVSFDLGITSSAIKPTDQRITEFKEGKDPALASLYFQFGRYLLICSSYPGSQPANLQGKWNEKLSPPWDSKYTVNINTEMNYWPAEITGLPEMHQPLFQMLKELSVTGRESASQMYHARGWNVHHNTDVWRITGLVDGGFFGMWPMGGAWLSQHLWQHYLFTGDKTFLKEYYPVLKGAALFFADVLQEEPSHRWLVVAPSMSPENTYMNGVGISAGTTMDNQLVFDVFSNAIRSSDILDIDKDFADTLRTMIERLPPMQIGRFGQLQEWLHDWDKENDRHRHVSHLYGLFPAAQISPYNTPELFEAAKNTLISRGDKSTGWSMGWKVNLWARLLDGNRAYKLIQDQLNPAPLETNGQNGGTYPNLFDAHPPFQIDGNFGCTSGIAEMLLQSHDGAIHILPAIPDQWKQGSVKGLIARGGFVVDVSWNNGKISYLKVKSTLGGNCRLRVHGQITAKGNVLIVPAKGTNPNPLFAVAGVQRPIVSEKASLKGIHVEKGNLYDLPTQPGEVYEFLIK